MKLLTNIKDLIFGKEVNDIKSKSIYGMRMYSGVMLDVSQYLGKGIQVGDLMDVFVSKEGEVVAMGMLEISKIKVEDDRTLTSPFLLSQRMDDIKMTQEFKGNGFKVEASTIISNDLTFMDKKNDEVIADFYYILEDVEFLENNTMKINNKLAKTVVVGR